MFRLKLKPEEVEEQRQNFVRLVEEGILQEMIKYEALRAFYAYLETKIGICFIDDELALLFRDQNKYFWGVSHYKGVGNIRTMMDIFGQLFAGIFR